MPPRKSDSNYKSEGSILQAFFRANAIVCRVFYYLLFVMRSHVSEISSDESSDVEERHEKKAKGKQKTVAEEELQVESGDEDENEDLGEDELVVLSACSLRGCC